MKQRGYKFRIYPNKEQEKILAQYFGATRWVYNHLLGLKSWLYSSWKSGKHSSKPKTDKCTLKRFLSRYKKKEKYAWLNGVHSQALQQASLNLDTGYQALYRKQGGYPNFKSKHGHQSFQIPQGFDIHKGKLYLPKFGKTGIKINQHRDFPENSKLKSVTVSRTPTGKYYASFCVEDSFLESSKTFIRESCGIDLGLFSLVATSYGEKIAAPKFLRKMEKRLKFFQRKFSKSKKGSKNRIKASLKVAKIHEKVANQRRDFLHKLSHKLTHENQVIYAENLSVKNMVKNHYLAKSIQDASWSTLLNMISYKGTLKKIGRYNRSTGVCPCGHTLLEKLDLKIREWCCPVCGQINDRDTAAAIQVQKIGRGTPDSKPLEKKTSGRSFKRSFKPSSMKEEFLPVIVQETSYV